MSRAQDLIIQARENEIAGLRAQVSGLQGELLGQRRGESRVAEQLSSDIQRAAVREDGHRQARDRAFADVRRLLRTVAGHVLDERAAGSSAVELLVDELGLAGFSMNGPLAMVAAERAESAARRGAHMSAAALVDAPVPHRTA